MAVPAVFLKLRTGHKSIVTTMSSDGKPERFKVSVSATHLES